MLALRLFPLMFAAIEITQLKSVEPIDVLQTPMITCYFVFTEPVVPAVVSAEDLTNIPPPGT